MQFSQSKEVLPLLLLQIYSLLPPHLLRLKCWKPRLFSCFLIDCLCQSQRIHRMNQFCFIDDIFYFVSLQMTNHMPFDVWWKLLIFFSQLLYFIFTKTSYSFVINFLQHRNWFCLAHGNQSDFTSFSFCSFTSICNFSSTCCKFSDNMIKNSF